MGAAKLPVTGAAKLPGRRWSGPVLAAVLVAVAACGGSEGTNVPPPTATERADTVPILQRAADTQGICYGWHLEDSNRYGPDAVISVGSNLGDGVPVADDPRCPRWVEVTARIHYTSQSSESNDYASVQVDDSGDIGAVGLAAGLARFGLTDDAFIDDPGWAVCRAAAVLPLLVAEAGAATPAPVDTAPPTAAPAALPDPGSDFWRDRWGFVIATLLLLLFTGLLLTVGFVKRRNRAQS